MTTATPRIHWGRLVFLALVVGLVWFFWPRITSLGPRILAFRDDVNQAIPAPASVPQTVAPAANPVVLPSAVMTQTVSAASAGIQISSTSLPMLNGNVFQTPVQATSTKNGETAWLIAEPGVLLDATATFDRGSSSPTHYMQCPEGGFVYVSAGHGSLKIDDVTVQLMEGPGVNNLVLVRCNISDGKPETDLNITAEFTNYQAGNIMTSPMPQGAYISLGWVDQRVAVSTGQAQAYGTIRSDGNCGGSGCPKTYIVTHDAQSNKTQYFLVNGANWDLVNGN